MATNDQSMQDRVWSCQLLKRRRLTTSTFELCLSRPPDFDFKAGQRICLQIGQIGRDYSLVTPPGAGTLAVLVRRIPAGRVTPLLDQLPIGAALTFTGPEGHFVLRDSQRQAVMVATGTGIAPFAAMIHEGARPSLLLHGVRTAEELYYRETLQAAAGRYVPCLSNDPAPPEGAFNGYVTRFLQEHVPPCACDFYLAGRMAMIHDALAIIDDGFPEARVYTEAFF